MACETRARSCRFLSNHTVEPAILGKVIRCASWLLWRRGMLWMALTLFWSLVGGIIELHFAGSAGIHFCSVGKKFES